MSDFYLSIPFSTQEGDACTKYLLYFYYTLLKIKAMPISLPHFWHFKIKWLSQLFCTTTLSPLPTTASHNRVLHSGQPTFRVQLRFGDPTTTNKYHPFLSYLNKPTGLLQLKFNAEISSRIIFYQFNHADSLNYFVIISLTLSQSLSVIDLSRAIRKKVRIMSFSIIYAVKSWLTIPFALA